MRRGAGDLGLLIDPETDTRVTIRRMLMKRGWDLVHARSGIAGLELIHRLADSFRLVIVSLDLPGLSGVAVIETLRQFRPELPLLCLGEGQVARIPVGAGICLAKPVNDQELAAQMDGVLEGSGSLAPFVAVEPQALARAKARYAVSGNLVEAAFELERGISAEEY